MKFNRLVPELRVSDIEKSLRFYTENLGFRIEYRREESGFAFISRDGAQLMLEENPDSEWGTGRLEHPFGRGANFQMIVKDLAPILERLKNNNYPIKMAPKESWYRREDALLGVREFLVQDPDGYLLRFSQGIGRKIVGKNAI